MLSSLEIKNFRTFSHLVIERLGRVNLIVGQNNVGKTTLLEALRLSGSLRPGKTANSILHERNEILSASEGKTRLALNSLFNLRNMDTCSVATIGEKGAASICRLRPVCPHDNYPATTTTTPPPGHVVTTTTTPPPGYFTTDSPNLYIEITSLAGKDSLQSDGTVATFITSHSDFQRPDFIQEEPPYLRFVDTQADTDNLAAQWWDSVPLGEGEDRVYEAVEILIPNPKIKYIADPRNKSRRIAIVQIESESEPVPLASLGDGVVRMFQIAAAMENAKVQRNQAIQVDPNMDSVLPLLLIDEVETGIHHTLHAKLWSFIFHAAAELDVQVFATTHSSDCLRGFAQAVEEDTEADAMAIRLERVEDEEQTGAVMIDRVGLPIVIRDSIEVR